MGTPENTESNQSTAATTPTDGGPKTPGVSIAALILGILLCLGCFTGIPAIICGIIGMKKANDDPANVGGWGMSLTGVILGITSIVLSMVFVIVCGKFFFPLWF